MDWCNKALAALARTNSCGGTNSSIHSYAKLNIKWNFKISVQNYVSSIAQVIRNSKIKNSTIFPERCRDHSIYFIQNPCITTIIYLFFATSFITETNRFNNILLWLNSKIKNIVKFFSFIYIAVKYLVERYCYHFKLYLKWYSTRISLWDYFLSEVLSTPLFYIVLRYYVGTVLYEVHNDHLL